MDPSLVFMLGGQWLTVIVLLFTISRKLTRLETLYGKLPCIEKGTCPVGAKRKDCPLGI